MPYLTSIFLGYLHSALLLTSHSLAKIGGRPGRFKNFTIVAGGDHRAPLAGTSRFLLSPHLSYGAFPCSQSVSPKFFKWVALEARKRNNNLFRYKQFKQVKTVWQAHYGHQGAFLPTFFSRQSAAIMRETVHYGCTLSL